MSGYTREYCVEMEAKFAAIAAEITARMVGAVEKGSLAYDGAKAVRDRAESERNGWAQRIDHIDWQASRAETRSKEDADKISRSNMSPIARSLYNFADMWNR